MSLVLCFSSVWNLVGGRPLAHVAPLLTVPVRKGAGFGQQPKTMRVSITPREAPAQPLGWGPHSLYSVASDTQGGPACIVPFISLGACVHFCNVPPEASLRPLTRSDDLFHTVSKQNE